MKPTPENLQLITQQPGCYIYRDGEGTILYIGKAVNLRNRVNSYFKRKNLLEPKIASMVTQIDDIELFTVGNEVEALILETNLIKKHKPKYNRLMKDDKNYIWVMFDPSKPFYKPEIVREKNPKNKNVTYFGPFPQKFPAALVLRRLRKIFPYCLKNFSYEEVAENGQKILKGKEKRPCLDYHIGLCSGVCAGLVGEKEHRKNVNSIKRFFQSQKADMLSDLREKMQKYAQERNFEKAQEIRDQLLALEYVTQRINVGSDTDEEDIEKVKKEAALESVYDLVSWLKIDLLQKQSKNILEKYEGMEGFRIECYDISNIQGTNATASMVVFVGGKPLKDHYRKFKIKTKSTPDDFTMMKEVLTRRFKRKVNDNDDPSFAATPNLLIVDGGKGQLSSAYSVFKEFGLVEEIPLAGLAKRIEELFFVEREFGKELMFKRVLLPRRSSALFLVQRIRDEAHRFALGYHRKLRSRGFAKSLLDEIPGIGDVTKRRLLQAFGSLDGIKKASKGDLLSVVKNKRTAEAIMKMLSV